MAGERNPGPACQVERPARVVPTVDGDFAALIVFDAGLAADVQAALAEECRRAGINLEILTESEFRGW